MTSTAHSHLALALLAPVATVAHAQLASAAVAAIDGTHNVPYEAVVEAVRQTVVAAQVPGAIVELRVRAGDKVGAGQVLARIDARAAEQSAAAGAAHALAARAALDAATREFERQKQLHSQRFISQAALDQAEARFKSAQAEAAAQLASAGAARTQSDFHVIKAPYAGVVANVSAVVGDMALPGKPLMTVYDPSALRITASIPQRAASALNGRLVGEAEIPGVTAAPVKPTRIALLPAVDAATHTMELRMDLPPATNAVPGMFARAHLAGAAGNDARFFVSAQALVRRGEVAAVYVLGADGKATLRQVRPGRGSGPQLEILSGVGAGERVALDPQAAARLH